MTARIPDDHPLRDLFHSLVDRTFRRELGIREAELTRYVGEVLVNFTHRDNIFRIRDARGRPLEEVAEMLMEGDVSLHARSFDREREVHKHIGDFTLFWTGVYPEMLRFFRAASRKDHLIDYVEQGRRSYRIASTFRYGPYAEEAPVLLQLSDRFETCMFGLHLVRRELEACSSPEMRAVTRLLES